MTETYSTYEAKAKLSEILRKVRSGQIVQISHRGEVVAEVRPVSKDASPFEQRFAELIARGVLTPAVDEHASLEPIANRPGALARFLADRNE